MKTFTKLSITISSTTILLILLDQFSKLKIVGDFFKFQYSENTGIAFGIPIPLFILIILSTILLLVVIYFAIKELNIEKKITQTATVLILAGGMSNLIDRIFRGYVVDFISIWKYPTFNIADIYIVAGVLLVIVFYGKIKKA